MSDCQHHIQGNIGGSVSRCSDCGESANDIIASLQAELAQSTDLMHTAIDEALRAYEAQIGQLEAELTEARANHLAAEQELIATEAKLDSMREKLQVSAQNEAVMEANHIAAMEDLGEQLNDMQEKLAQAETHVAGDIAARQAMGMFHATADDLYDAIMDLKEHDAQATAEAALCLDLLRDVVKKEG